MVSTIIFKFQDRRSVVTAPKPGTLIKLNKRAETIMKRKSLSHCIRISLLEQRED